jgi:hypothetical protein
MHTELWAYREAMIAPTDTIIGFAVEALDGKIGHIDEATDEAGAGYIVVDTGPWILGRKVMIPAGAITHVDLDEQQVMLALTKDQIKNSPEFDPNMGMKDTAYRERLGDYYEPFFPSIP